MSVKKNLFISSPYAVHNFRSRFYTGENTKIHEDDSSWKDNSLQLPFVNQPAQIPSDIRTVARRTRRSKSNARRSRKLVAYRSNALTRIVSSTINPHPDWPLGQCLRASFGNWFVVLANFRRLLFASPHPFLLRSRSYLEFVALLFLF